MALEDAHMVIEGINNPAWLAEHPERRRMSASFAESCLRVILELLQSLIVHGHGPCTQDGQLGTEARLVKAACEPFRTVPRPECATQHRSFQQPRHYKWQKQYFPF